MVRSLMMLVLCGCAPKAPDAVPDVLPTLPPVLDAAPQDPAPWPDDDDAPDPSRELPC